MADISVILTKLLERTNQDKISWQTTADEDAFLAVLGNSSVSISAQHSLLISSEYILRILNHEGREIERIVTSTVFS